MAFSFAKLFGLGKKSPDISNIMNAPVQKQLTEFPTGTTLNQRILDALNKGQNIGFPSDYVSRTTSPVVASREARFKEEELPFLSSEMSGRGLGRSTIAGRELGRISQAKERDINEIIANAYLQNELQKKTDIGRYEDLANRFATTESNISGNVANERVRREGIGLGLEQARQSEDTDLNTRILNALGPVLQAAGMATTAIPGIGPVIGPILSGAGGIAGSLSDMSKSSTSDLSSLLQLLKNKPFVTAGA